MSDNDYLSTDEKIRAVANASGQHWTELDSMIYEKGANSLVQRTNTTLDVEGLRETLADDLYSRVAIKKANALLEDLEDGGGSGIDTENVTNSLRRPKAKCEKVADEAQPPSGVRDRIEGN
jgi:hypothetical protein